MDGGAKFNLGRVVITANAQSKLDVKSISDALQRHHKGDWGNMVAEDKAQNDEALMLGNRLMSSYLDSKGTNFWIITEADRSVTTILLPEDY